MKNVKLFIVLAAGFAASTVHAQDWYQATGKPVQRSLLNSADLRTEFALIQSDIADKLPILTGNAGMLVGINDGGTGLEAFDPAELVASLNLEIGVDVQAYDADLTTLGALGAGARTALGLTIGTNVQAYDADLSALAANSSSTVGQTMRVTGAGTYAWGALDLADGDAITGDIPDANLSANVPLLNAANTFTASQSMVLANPVFLLRDSSGSGTDMTTYLSMQDNGSVERGYIGFGSGNTTLSISNSIGPVAITATALTWGGNTLFTTANDGSGSGLDADLLDGNSSAAFALAATTISVSGTGLSGGGSLAANRTITIDQTAMTTRNITGKAGVTKTLSTSAASGGSDGDIWYRY